MSLCKDSTELTFDGVRADDGGQPEEVTLVITKYCINDSPDYGGFVADYDKRVDVTFDFSPLEDGEYKVEYVGGVTGIIETDNVFVKQHAENNIGANAKADVKKMMCNTCLDDEYMFKKALVSMGVEFSQCERFCEA